MAPERVEPAVRLEVFWQLLQVEQDFCSVWRSERTGGVEENKVIKTYTLNYLF